MCSDIPGAVYRDLLVGTEGKQNPGPNMKRFSTETNYPHFIVGCYHNLWAMIQLLGDIQYPRCLKREKRFTDLPALLCFSHSHQNKSVPVVRDPASRFAFSLLS